MHELISCLVLELDLGGFPLKIVLVEFVCVLLIDACSASVPLVSIWLFNVAEAHCDLLGTGCSGAKGASHHEVKGDVCAYSV